MTVDSICKFKRYIFASVNATGKKSENCYWMRFCLKSVSESVGDKWSSIGSTVSGWLGFFMFYWAGKPFSVRLVDQS